MKNVALTLCAAVVVMALSAGTTLAVLTWAPERLPQGVPGERGEAGKQGPRGPRGKAVAVEPDVETFEADSETDRLADLERAAREDERAEKADLRSECAQLHREFSTYGARGRTPGPPTELEQQAMDRYNSLNCSQH